MLFRITNHCSNGCPHCLNDCKPDDSHCTLETIHQFVKFFNSTTARTILIGGGEPTEHPRFFQYVNYICKNIGKESIVLIATNGSFLSNKRKRNAFISLTKKHKILSQISAIPNLYPNASETESYYNRFKYKFKHVEFIATPTVIDKIGRAKGVNWDEKFPHLFQRRAPSCINLFATAYHHSTKSFNEILDTLENSKLNYCKPGIAPDGSIHAGESNECVKVGTIYDSLDTIFRNIKRQKPCHKCGIRNDEFINTINQPEYRNR